MGIGRKEGREKEVREGKTAREGVEKGKEQGRAERERE